MNSQRNNPEASNPTQGKDITPWVLLAVTEAETALRRIGSMLSGIDRGFDLWPDIHATERWIYLLSRILPENFIRCYKLTNLARKNHSFGWFDLANRCQDLHERSNGGEELAYTKLDQERFDGFLSQSVTRLAKGLDDDSVEVRNNTAWLLGHFPTAKAKTILQSHKTKSLGEEMTKVVTAAMQRIDESMDPAELRRR